MRLVRAGLGPAAASTSPNLLSGRNFDKNGNMLDWWSNFSRPALQGAVGGMVYQYGNYSWDLADDQNVSGHP